MAVRAEPKVRFKGRGDDPGAAIHRAAILFDGATTEIEIEPDSVTKLGTLNLAGFAGLGQRNLVRPPKTFELNVAQFLKRARLNRPTEPVATASGFSQWVYSLYGNQQGDESDKENGLEIEQAVWKRRIEVAMSNDAGFLQRYRPEWFLEHCGLHVDDASIGYYEVPNLAVAGKPLRCSPDLLYLNIRTMKYVIVEVKYSRMDIPTNLWPNVWAQLWCYSQLPSVSRSNGVTVVGEVWRDSESGIIRDQIFGPKIYPELESESRQITLKASVRRDPRKPAYDRFFRRLFDIYRGVE